MEWQDIKTAPRDGTRVDRWFFFMIGFFVGMFTMAVIKGDNLYAFWRGLTGG